MGRGGKILSPPGLSGAIIFIIEHADHYFYCINIRAGYMPIAITLIKQ
jgi:hypothetical protein